MQPVKWDLLACLVSVVQTEKEVLQDLVAHLVYLANQVRQGHLVQTDHVVKRVSQDLLEIRGEVSLKRKCESCARLC